MVGVMWRRKEGVMRFAHDTNALASAQIKEGDCEWRQKAFVDDG